MDVITYEMVQSVRVRKYKIDCLFLCKCLREHKKHRGISNKEIANRLGVPLTKVEHWFRNDISFAIPDECVWFKLKEVLGIKTDEFDKAITTFEEKDNIYEKGNRLYDSAGISPTLTCTDANINILQRSNGMEVKVIGQMDNTIDHTFESANRVYDIGGVSPTINTCGGGGLQPKILEDKTIVAMRGRNPDNLSDRTVGSPTEQRLEPNSQGICNTLTSVQKDNLVMETVRIKQATSQGYIECEVGGVADLSFPDSNTRRGRVQENGQVSPTLMAGEQDICRIENVYDFYNNNLKSDGVCGTITSCCSHNGSGTFGVIEPQYRIRKLTPLECWSLMDFSEEDFLSAKLGSREVAKEILETYPHLGKRAFTEIERLEKMSNTQLYKQAGNSIVKNVLVAILGQMIPGKEEVYKNI